jgi:hypothetical protein
LVTSLAENISRFPFRREVIDERGLLGVDWVCLSAI